jgi:hypothetical protein
VHIVEGLRSASTWGGLWRWAASSCSSTASCAMLAPAGEALPPWLLRVSTSRVEGSKFRVRG